MNSVSSARCGSRSPVAPLPLLLVGSALLLVCGTADRSEADEPPSSHTLISTTENRNPDTWELKSSDEVPACPVPWRVKLSRLHGGKQEGVQIIELEAGELRIVVVPTRGLGIWSVTAGDLRLGWDSPVREIVHPQFVNLAARGGLGWLDGFGEFLCRCGLENNGHPGRDIIRDNTGAESTVDLTLHGKQAYLPAQSVRLTAQRTPPYRLTLTGLVEERMMHGPKLELETELAIVLGKRSFQITDQVRNASANPSEFELLYHANFGKPLLAAGAELVAPLADVTPFNARAAEGEGRDALTFLDPTPGYVEQVYCLRALAGEDGRTLVMLRNRAGDRGARIGYSARELPCLTLWKNTAAEADGYVAGIEPGTNFPHNRRYERAAGRVPKLAGGETFRTSLEFGLLLSADEVAQTAADIANIQGTRATQYNLQPEPDPLAGK